MLFRRILVLIRNQYLHKRARLFLISIGAIAALSGVTFALDFVLPWHSWGMIIRTLILIPTAVAIFVMMYSASLGYHFYKVKDESWTPVRQRFSPTWRQRISMVIGAILFVLVYATAMKPGYTLTSSVIVAIIIGLFAFMRKTSNELGREELGIPDARDAAINTHLRRYANSTPAARSDIRAKKKADEKSQAKVEKARADLAKAEAELEDSE